MYLKKVKKKDGRIYLTIAEGRHINGKSKTFHLETIGYVDELISPTCPDPIAYWTEEVARRNKEAKQKQIPLVVEFSPKQKIDKRGVHTLELGAAIVDRYFYCDLGIWDFFEKKRTARKFDFDPVRILELLVFDRIAHPSSKKACFENKDHFPRKCDFTLDDMYRALTYFDKHSTSLIDAMNASFARVRGPRALNHFYYDVTNYYFEIETEDIKGLRRRGVSKEHRPNPIVQMGLLLDADGIPYNFDIFSGNTNDMITLLPVMKKAHLRDVNERVVIVADKGLNTSTNIAACLLDNNGFIFSQSVRKATADLKKWVLTEKGYSYNADNTYKRKSRISEKTIFVEDANGKKHPEAITVKEVAFWSKDHFDKARAERERTIAKSVGAIENGEMNAAIIHSKARYVKSTPVNKQTGEIGVLAHTLDEKKIAEDEALDGYYCIVTSEVEMSDKEILDAYRGLWRIEESFRVIKGDFSARPVYLSREDHIKAHFLICYIALMITRLIQLDTNHQYSATQIAQAIRNIVGHNLDKNLFYFDYRTDITDELCKAVGIDLTRRIMTKGEITEVMADVRKPDTKKNTAGKKSR